MGKAKVIAIANNKGGVGKTTTAISLAALYADWNLRVALIDNDPQGNVGVYLGRHLHPDVKRNVADLYTGMSLSKIGTHTLLNDWIKKYHLHFKQENLEIFLADQRLAHVSEDFSRIAKLTEALEEIKSEFDLILIDNGPYIGYLTRSALLAADLVLIPTEAGIGGLAGISQIIKEAESINARHWRTVAIRVFVNNFQHTEESEVTNLHKLRALVGNRLYNTCVPANVHVRKSKELGLPIHLIGKLSKNSVAGATAFRILGKTILQDVLPDLLQEMIEKNKSALNRITSTYAQKAPAKSPGIPGRLSPNWDTPPKTGTSPETPDKTQNSRNPASHPSEFESGLPFPAEHKTKEQPLHSTGTGALSSRPFGECVE